MHACMHTHTQYTYSVYTTDQTNFTVPSGQLGACLNRIALAERSSLVKPFRPQCISSLEYHAFPLRTHAVPLFTSMQWKLRARRSCGQET